MHPRLASLLLALMVLFALAGCSKADGGAHGAGAAGGPQSSSRATRTTIDMSITVDDVAASVDRVRAAAVGAGGWVGEATIAGDHDRHTGSVVVRVPVAGKEDVRATLRGMGDVERESESAEDLTEQRADLDARLHNAREEEKRLVALMSDHTGSLADVIAVEKELAGVREGIEKLEAEQRVMAAQVDYAAFTVTLSERAAAGEGAGKRIAGAAREGLSAAWQLVVIGAMVLVAAAPTTLLLGAMAYVVLRLVKAVRRRAIARTAAA
jgi:hypothetical protein